MPQWYIKFTQHVEKQVRDKVDKLLEDGSKTLKGNCLIQPCYLDARITLT